ncbi:MAG: hypothetical protein K1X57_16740 [Gemmataceae bacterium]|nr:hypothetical protein [Gemmataceae bacterium]
MSPQPGTGTLSPEQAQKASRKIDEAFEEVARLAGSDLAPTEFFQDFLNKVIGGIDSPAGAVWLRTPQGFLQLQCQINIENVGLDRHKNGRQSHNELLRQAFQMGRPMLLEPYGTSGILEGLPAGNPTEYFCLLVPVQMEKESTGLLELWTESRYDARMQRTFLNYLVQMAGYAAQFLRNQTGRKLVGQEQLWAQVESFAREIHSSLDPTRVAYSIANEGRRLIGCDRLSVAVVADRKARIESVSGSDVVEKRSNLIILMKSLCDKVIKWGEKLVFQGTKDDSLPPDVLEALDEYLAEANSKFLVLQPLRDERQKDLPSVTRSALLMESFDPPANTEALISRLDVVGKHATSALYNAVELEKIPLKWMWLPVAKVQQGLGGKTKAIMYAAVAGVTLLVASMFVIPYPLKLDSAGQLLPTERQKVYASHEGIVKEFLISRNASFDAGHQIALVYDQQLESTLRGLSEEIKTAENAAQGINQQLGDQKDPVQRVKLVGEREQQLSIARAKTRERDQLVKINNADPSRPGYFYVQAPKFNNSEASTHEPQWTVLDADFLEQHLNKYIRPNEPMVRLGDKNGPWELELKIPQKHINQVLRAFDPTVADPKLQVDLLVTSHPTSVFKGVLYKSRIAGEAVQNKDDHNEQSPVVIAYVSLDDPEIPEAYRIPPDLLVTGVEVRCKVRCGNHRMGYSLFYGLWEFLYEKVVFWF